MSVSTKIISAATFPKTAFRFAGENNVPLKHPSPNLTEAGRRTRTTPAHGHQLPLVTRGASSPLTAFQSVFYSF